MAKIHPTALMLVWNKSIVLRICPRRAFQTQPFLTMMEEFLFVMTPVRRGHATLPAIVHKVLPVWMASAPPPELGQFGVVTIRGVHLGSLVLIEMKCLELAPWLLMQVRMPDQEILVRA